MSKIELMRIFKDTEFVEQLGSGMNRMMTAYKPNIFHVTPNFFHVIFFFDEDAKQLYNMPDGTLNSKDGTINDRLNVGNDTLNADNPINDRINSDGDRLNDRLNLSESETSVFYEIEKNPFIKTEEIVLLTGLSMPTVSRAIKSLRQKNIIEREGSKKTGHWRVKAEANNNA